MEGCQSRKPTTLSRVPTHTKHSNRDLSSTNQPRELYCYYSISSLGQNEAPLFTTAHIPNIDGIPNNEHQQFHIQLCCSSDPWSVTSRLIHAHRSARRTLGSFPFDLPRRTLKANTPPATPASRRTSHPHGAPTSLPFQGEG